MRQNKVLSNARSWSVYSSGLRIRCSALVQVGSDSMYSNKQKPCDIHL